MCYPKPHFFLPPLAASPALVCMEPKRCSKNQFNQKIHITQHTCINHKTSCHQLNIPSSHHGSSWPYSCVPSFVSLTSQPSCQDHSAVEEKHNSVNERKRTTTITIVHEHQNLLYVAKRYKI